MPDNNLIRIDAAHNADSFLLHVRTIQRDSGLKLVGACKISAEARERIDNFLCTANLPQLPGQTQAQSNELIVNLLSKYEMLCERRKVDAPSNGVSRRCYQQLISEFESNVAAFPIEPARLISASVQALKPLHIALQAEPLCSFLAKHKAMLFRALTSFPSDPIGYLESGYQRYVELGTITNGSKPLTEESRLRLAFAVAGGTSKTRHDSFNSLVVTILGEKEFRDYYAKSRWVVAHAISTYGKNARTYLREIKKSVEALRKEEQFQSLLKQPGTFFAAAIRKPQGTSEFLASVLAQEERIKVLAEKTGTPISAKQRRDISLRTPAKARLLEEQLKEMMTPSKVTRCDPVLL